MPVIFYGGHFYLVFISFLIIFVCNQKCITMELAYSIDGRNFKDYGVYVSSSQGLIGGLKPKKGLAAEWPDENGSYPDLEALCFEGRNIVLNCFMKADSAQQFIGRIDAFCALFYTVGEHILKLELGDKALVYKVRLADAINVEKKFRDERMIASFSLKLFEYAPVLP